MTFPILYELCTFNLDIVCISLFNVGFTCPETGYELNLVRGVSYLLRSALLFVVHDK